MPRRRADKVIEHRMSLSDGLHKEIKQALKSQKLSSQVGMAGNGAKAVLNVAAVGGIGAIAYLGVKAYAEAKGVFPSVKESFQSAWDWGFGVQTNADGSIVPTTVTITNAAGNQETVANPINSIPILNKTPFVGGLFDWGMKLGAATNPFEGDPVLPDPVVPDDSIWQAKIAADEEAERQRLQEIYLQNLIDKEPEVFQEKAEEQFADDEANPDAEKFAWELVGSESTPGDVAGDVFEETEFFSQHPDDSRRHMTLMEWAIWTGRNGVYGGDSNDVTDSGKPINGTMNYAQYVNWYSRL